MLASDAAGFRKAMSGTIAEADRLHNSILKWSNAANAARALGDVVNQLQSTFKGLTDAYAVRG